MIAQLSRLFLAIGILFTAWAAAAAEAPKSIRIGYAVSLSGVNAQGAAVTTLPAYKLWVDDVNKKGGLMVKEFGKRIPIEVTEYDDTSNVETMLRLSERLMTQDKVDFVLPPWSTGFNLAAAPVFARNGYPQLTVTANSNDEAALVKQMPTLFFFLNEPRNFGAALGGILGKLKSEGKINNKIAMVSVADQFGAELSSGATPVLKQAGFDIVVSKTYPLGASDLTNEVKEAKASGADTFIAYSYPPDTFMLTGTSATQGYTPKVFHVGVGTAFAAYGANFKTRRRVCWAWAAGIRRCRARRNTCNGRRRCSAATPTAGPRRSPTPACRCWSRRSRRPARSIARKCSTPSPTTGPGRPSSGRSISRATSAASSGASGNGRAVSSSASRRAICPAPNR
jgi:ABC-type branched-subunit amino acid transport system substrate-binding protein